jgi:hypothetical protein
LTDPADAAVEAEAPAVEAEAPAVEAEAPAEAATEEGEVAEVEASVPADEVYYPKVTKRDEDADIKHYSPKPHTELDPSTRF